MFDVSSDFSNRLDTWLNNCIYSKIDQWNASNEIPIKELIRSLSISKLSNFGLDQNELNQKLYLHYKLAQQPFGSIGFCVASHVDIATLLIYSLGNEGHKELLNDATEAKKIMCLAMTEPEAGTDLLNAKSLAIPDSDGWLLNAEKVSITNAPFADAAIVLARTSVTKSPFSFSLFVLPLDWEGVERHDTYQTMGYEGCISGFTAKNVLLPNNYLLGNVGTGMISLLKHLNFERLIISTRIAGICRYALDKTLYETRRRKTFGNTLIENQQIQFRLAELEADWLAYMSFLLQVKDSSTIKNLSPRRASMLKYSGNKLLKQVTDNYLQVSGGRGYMCGHNAERLFREIPALSIAGGSDEALLTLISKEYVKGISNE